MCWHPYPTVRKQRPGEAGQSLKVTEEGMTVKTGTYLLEKAGTQHPCGLTTCVTDMELGGHLPSGHTSGDPEVRRVGMAS